MTLEIHWGSGSNFSWRVLLAAELKGVAYASRLIDFSQGGHKTPAFLAMNPRHKVPVLREGDTVVYESVAILHWLDRRSPERPLFGATLADAARIERLCAEVTSYLDAPLATFVRAAFSEGRRHSRDEALVAQATLTEELAHFEHALTGDHFAGDAPSAVECMLYPHLAILRRAADKPWAADLGSPFSALAPFPRLAAWRARLDASAAVQATWPPHWTD